jgi:CheY-like chemotaxis protein
MKPISILVADDEQPMRELLVKWLTGNGHEVASAASGHEAVRLLQKQRFDLVIADVLMPDGDGLELISESKKTQPHARILAISGGGRYLHGNDCLKVAKGLGAHAAVLKPFSLPELLQGISVAIPAAAG